MQQEPLSRFSAVRTHDADELRQRMAGLFSVRSMDFGRGTSKTFRGHLNHRQLRDVGLMYARYGAPLEAYLSHGDSYLQGFPLRGHGQYVLDGTGGDASRNRGITVGPGTDLRLRYSAHFEHLILRIEPQRLVRTLSRLIDRPIDPPLRMTASASPSPATAAHRRLVEFVVHELDRTSAPLPELVLTELEQTLVLSFLSCNPHNYSNLLGDNPVRSAAPWQVRLAEQYIEQHWDQPMTIEALALATNASVRSLFYSIRRSRGVSPMVFLRQVRLRHAKEMLTNAGPATSVTSVAYACGFSNLGHFARYYHAAFGEHPSATLKAARG
ncbi:MAG: AraC family transcriptional regulator [Bradyrhizobium sp.]|nr:AraC family transcriptional regulator [Bradyrhizobium sp.]